MTGVQYTKNQATLLNGPIQNMLGIYISRGNHHENCVRRSTYIMLYVCGWAMIHRQIQTRCVDAAYMSLVQKREDNKKKQK